jgi:UDP-3-O-[3-hydroxymyristoyl] glucosamine N-acyltransferase
MGTTLIKRGVKLDNLIQVAHNVVIDEDTVIAAQTGIAGSSKVGKHCMIGGQVGIVGHVMVADNTQIGAQAGVISTVKEENRVLLGMPAIDHMDYMRAYAQFRKSGKQKK